MFARLDAWRMLPGLVIACVSVTPSEAQTIDLGGLIGNAIQNAIRQQQSSPFVPQAPRYQAPNRAGRPVENSAGVDRYFGSHGQPTDLRSAIGLPVSRFTFEGLPLDGPVDPRSLPKEFVCRPSDEFPGSTWCRQIRRDRKGLTASSLLLSRDGGLGYGNKFVRPATFGPGEITQEINRLTTKFGTPPNVSTMPSRLGGPSGVIVTWGEITLIPLGEDELDRVASGHAVRTGLLLDFLGDLGSSAKQKLPIYRIAGGPGFLWTASYDQMMRGTLRFGVADASSYGPANQIGGGATASSAPFDPTKVVGSAAKVAPTIAPGAGEVPRFEAAARFPDLSKESPPADEDTVELVFMTARPDLYTTDLDALHYAARQLRSGSKECSQFHDAISDEVSIGSAVVRAREVMNRALEKARGLGATTSMELSTILPVGNYDTGSGSFVFDKGYKNTFKDPIAAFTWNFDFNLSRCSADPSPRAMRTMSDPLLHAHKLTIDVRGGDRVKTLDVDPEMAKFLIRNMPRMVADVEILVRGRDIDGRIRSARAVVWRDPGGGSAGHQAQAVVVQRYPQSLFAGVPSGDAGASPGVTSDGGLRPIPSFPDHLVLNVIRLQPEMMTDALLLRRLPSIISEEQVAYREARTTNVRPAGAVFENDQIEGREPSYAAQSLLPEFRSYVRRRGATTSSVLQSGLDLTVNWQPYDFGSGKLPINRTHPLFLNPPNDKGLVWVGGGIQLKREDLRSIDDHVIYEPTPVRFPGDRWPEITRSLDLTLQEMRTPLLALDRLLVMPDLPMSAGRAEAITKALNNNDKVRSVVNYSVERVSTAPDGSAVLLGHVNYAAVVGPDGREIARFDAASFPAASAVTDAVEARRQAAADEKVAEQQAAAEAEAAARRAKGRAEADRVAALEKGKADHEREVAAGQERPAGGFGPQVGHVQLGMSMQEAERIVRSEMTVAAVIEPKPGTWGYSASLVHPRIFISGDAGSMVSIASIEGGGDRVVAISQRRALPVPPLGQSEIVALLEDKYGVPAEASGTTLVWADRWKDRPRFCKQITPYTQHNGYAVAEGVLPVMRATGGRPPADEYAKAAYAGLMEFDVADARAAASDLRECPTTLYSIYDPKPTDPSIKTAVFDGAWFAKLVGDAENAAHPARTQAVKDIIDR